MGKSAQGVCPKREMSERSQRLGEETKVQNRGNVFVVFLVCFGCCPRFGPQQCEL